jgi:hypothetical protein
MVIIQRLVEEGLVWCEEINGFARMLVEEVSGCLESLNPIG